MLNLLLIFSASIIVKFNELSFLMYKYQVSVHIVNAHQRRKPERFFRNADGLVPSFSSYHNRRSDKYGLGTRLGWRRMGEVEAEMLGVSWLI